MSAEAEIWCRTSYALVVMASAIGGYSVRGSVRRFVSLEIPVAEIWNWSGTEGNQCRLVVIQVRDQAYDGAVQMERGGHFCEVFPR
jgi:hypothetical protein